MTGMLGRSALKQRIQELEASLSDLRSRLAQQQNETKRLHEREKREGERRREAVAARQQAEERIHRLEDRIAQLQGDLERLGQDTPVAAGPAKHRQSIHARRMHESLSRLSSMRTGPQGALTASVQHRLPEPLQHLLGPRTHDVEEAAPCLLLADDLGLLALVLRPPLLPELEPVWSDRFTLEPEWFVPHGRYVLALARSDLLAVGIYEDERQTDFKALKPRVGRKHSRGGFSQGRFERIREEQIADHIKRARETLKGILDGLEQDHRLYLVGQRETIDALSKEFHPYTTKTVDSTGAPREALEDAHTAFWTTEVRRL